MPKPAGEGARLTGYNLLVLDGNRSLLGYLQPLSLPKRHRRE
jgi:hypothetical protein